MGFFVTKIRLFYLCPRLLSCSADKKYPSLANWSTAINYKLQKFIIVKYEITLYQSIFRISSSTRLAQCSNSGRSSCPISMAFFTRSGKPVPIFTSFPALISL